MTNKTLTLETEGFGDIFSIDVSGIEKTRTAVVFVHGFGVKRDSKGLFTDLQASLCDHAVTLNGSYSHHDRRSTTALPFTRQVDRLNATIAYAKEVLECTNLVFVGHSQGCIVLALAKPIDSQVFLLAPPLGDACRNFVFTPGWVRPGSELNIRGTSHIQRANGSFSYAPYEYWHEFYALGNVDPLYEALADTCSVQLVIGGADNVLGDQVIPDGIKSSVVDGADHYFSDSSRDVIVAMLYRELSQATISF